jgi:hypothetical protein
MARQVVGLRRSRALRRRVAFLTEAEQHRAGEFIGPVIRGGSRCIGFIEPIVQGQGGYDDNQYDPAVLEKRTTLQYLPELLGEADPRSMDPLARTRLWRQR